MGLTFTTPGIRLLGKGTVGADLTASNIQLNNQPRRDVLADDLQGKLKTVYHAPFSVSAGFNLGLRRFLIAISTQYYGSDNFLRVKTGAKAVLIVAVAYEYYLHEGLTLHMSIHNDMSYFDKDLNKTIGIKPDITTWDIYHLALGATIRRGRSSISTGLLFTGS